MDWNKFGKYWRAEKEGDSIEGEFVGIISKEIKGDMAHLPVIEVEGNQMELPAHVTLFAELKKENIQEGERIRITFTGKKEGEGKAKGKLVYQYQVEKL